MAEMNTVVEGKVKYRDGKKWKPRWCVMKKPSPVADRLQVFLYKDVKESVKGGNPKSNFPLDGFYGLESGICYDKETSVLAIICHKLITLLAFESRETLIQFEIKIRRSLGVEHQFPVRTIKVPSQSKLPLDLVRLHIHGQKFCLTAHIPPKILGSWQVSELRRFGNIDGKFCFEGGSRCGKGQGFHILQTDQADEIAEIIGHASSGKSAPIIRRQTAKRRSEYVEPVKNVISDNLFKKFQNVPVYTDQNYQEDQTWPHPKRHSISFTDYRRTKTYTDKQRLMSIENVEKERLMAIYDIPPRRVRKVESVQNDSESSQATPVRSHDVNLDAYRNVNAQPPQDYENYLNWTGEFNNNVMSYQVPTSISVSSNQSDTSSSHGGSVFSLQSIDPPANIPISSSAPALCGYGNQMLTNRYLACSQSVPNQIAEGEGGNGEVKGREEVLQSLQQTEADLEKEMTLLEEMLQVCQKEESRYNELPPPVPPPLPIKLSNSRRRSADAFFARGSLDNLSISSDNTHTRPSPRAGYSASILLSPNLVSKLKKIPSKSRMNAPLKYVNLDKYDIGDVDTNHVHLPAAASTSAPDGTGSWNEGLRSASRGYDNVRDDSGSSNKENKRISMSLPGSRENLRNISGSDCHLNLYNSRKISYSNEPIYANEQCETPPPELPPKGPALANRCKQRRPVNASSRPPPPPRPPDRHQSLQQRPERYRHHYQSPRQGRNPVYPPSSPTQEDYFLMGDFEKEPAYNLESQRLNESLFDRPVVSLPPRGKPSKKQDSSACYMEMSGPYDLERAKSFNDADSISSESSGVSPRPKFVRSLSASGSTGVSVETEGLPAKPVTAIDYVNSASAENSPREQRRATLIREENYMLMSSISPKKSVLENLRSLQDYVSTTVSGDGKIENGSVNSSKTDVPSDNGNRACYQTSKADVNVETTGGQNDSVVSEYIASKPELPFDNLIDFKQQPTTVRSTKIIELSLPGGKNILESANAKTPGFFSRLMRRNSKDRKSISQSHENLLSTSSSEPTIKEGVVFNESSSSAAIFESSGSEESNRSQSQQDLVLDPKDRSRSSSFPNRASFIAMNESPSSSSTGISILSQHSDLGATNSSLNSCGTVSTQTSSNDCQVDEGCNTSENVVSDSEKEQLKVDGESQPYCFAGKLEDRVDSLDVEVTEPFDTTGYGGMSDETKQEEQEGKISKANETVSDDSNSDKMSQDKHGGKVFTVLNVQGGNFSQNTCKTDDEKLIELWHSTHSLGFDKCEKDSIADLKSKMTLPLEEMSPDEKANAIARHISSLPPFIPPKMKSYPSKLSPVLERTTPKKDRPGPLSSAVCSVDGNEEKVESPVLSPSMMKQQAKATLRITPPSEDEHGKIWIPRSFQPQEAAPEENVDKKMTTLVVDVTELEQTDSVSLSSHDSSCYGEEVVRSSPASTILRPRSGKEYQKIERRRTVDESSTTSPLTTPQSPATGSVFTFEMLSPSSVASGYSCYGEMHSKMSQSEQMSMCASSLRSESILPAKAMYMNIDFSPPESPLPPPGGASGIPAEQVEPQLNYAEIDLSETGRLENSLQTKKLNYAEMDLSLSERPGGSFRQSKKGKKAAEPVHIEYSMIDMVATRAAQKARKEHAQSREGSLRRDRMSISSMSTKDRSLNMSTKSERKQAAASSAAQSSNSVDSTTF